MSENNIKGPMNIGWLHQYRMKAFLIALIIVLFIEMTDMLNGYLDISLMYLITLTISLVVIPIIKVRIVRHLLTKHVDPDEDNLTNQGFTYFFGSMVMAIIIIIVSLFMARWFPIFTLYEFSSTTATNLGIAVFIVLIIVTIVMKYWPLTILIALIGGQHLINIMSDDGSQISYYTIVMGTLLVLFIIGVIVMSVLITRDKDE